MALPSWFRATGAALTAAFEVCEPRSLEGASRIMASIVGSPEPVCISALSEAWRHVEVAQPEARLDAILRSLQRWAESAAVRDQQSKLQRGDKWIISAEECRDLLASAFWCNLKDPMLDYKEIKRENSGLDWRQMYSGSTLSAHKLACLWNYFIMCAMEETSGKTAGRSVMFEIITDHGPQAFLKSLGKQTEVSDELKVNVHNGLMEDVEATSFVNFANKLFGFGRFIPSMTQEEVLQMCCPEFNVGMLVIGTMEADEVVLVANCRRFSTYTGYLDSFQFSGPWTGDSRVQNIVTMDATRNRHFTPEMNLRDVYKAFLGFKGQISVSSGRWGCGAFGGQVDHKMLQQIIAAKAAGCKLLHFSAFKDQICCQDGVRIAEFCRGRSVAELYEVLLGYSERRDGVVNFLDAIDAESWTPKRQRCHVM